MFLKFLTVAILSGSILQQCFGDSENTAPLSVNEQFANQFDAACVLDASRGEISMHDLTGLIIEQLDSTCGVIAIIEYDGTLGVASIDRANQHVWAWFTPGTVMRTGIIDAVDRQVITVDSLSLDSPGLEIVSARLLESIPEDFNDLD